MSLDKSPTLNDFKDGLIQPEPGDSPGLKRIRAIMISLIVLIAFMSITLLFRSSILEVFSGYGTVYGNAINDNGAPFIGNVYVMGTDLQTTTDSSGYFELHNVPAGSNLVVIADQSIGYDYPVMIKSGEVVNIGVLRFKSTALP